MRASRNAAPPRLLYEAHAAVHLDAEGCDPMPISVDQPFTTGISRSTMGQRAGARFLLLARDR
jgi:hypothetical protein